MKKKILKIVVALGLFYTSNVLAMTEEEYQEIVSSYKLIDSNNIDKYTTLNSTYIRTYEEYKNLLKSNNIEDHTISIGFKKFFKINGEITRLRITPSVETNEIIVNISYPKGSSTSIDDYENIDIYDQRLYAVACLSKNKEIVISSIIRSSSKDKNILFRELDLIKAKYYELYGYVPNFFDLELVKDNLSLRIDKSYEENRDFPYFNEEKILNKLYKDGHCDKEDTKEANIEVFLADGKWVLQEESWDIKTLENNALIINQNGIEFKTSKYESNSSNGGVEVKEINKENNDFAKLKQQAEQGDLEAQKHLGFLYDKGRGVKQDRAEAVKWYRLAAEQGDLSAQYDLGLRYENGQGVQQDHAEATKWYLLAAEQGDLSAQNNLGVKYEHGLGVAQNYVEAIKWYRLAAEQKDVYAQYNLAGMYANGKGVTQDYTEAVKWYLLAAERGDSYAQNNLGALYENGKGVKQDYFEAVKWYRLSAEQGEASAQTNLGVMYSSGKGVLENIEEAKYWLARACENGNQAGCAKYQELNQE